MNSKNYRKTGTISLFDTHHATEQLKQKGNPLYRLLKVIDFEMFRGKLEENLLNHDKKNNAGAKPIDVVLMFKLLILQCLYNISDEMTEE
jgi:hypothetical protein